jgi:site-specific DNA-methyltransferase (adenine-specific)
VTDPPYGLAFMNKHWDYDVPSIEIWRECLRVLKPGGHLLAFGGTRTYHRLVVNIEDAGFEIRDQIQWIYGSGFPKSHNIKEGNFKGFGTALKPANEPICLARKPLEKNLTVADNVLKFGTGALNIDGTRIKYQSDADKNSATPQGIVTSKKPKDGYAKAAGVNSERHEIERPKLQGRWPANILFDEQAAEMLDAQSGNLKSGKLSPHHIIRERENRSKGFEYQRERDQEFGGDSVGASRFFYVAKASKRERNEGLEGMPYKMRSDANKMMGDSGHMKTGSGNDRTTEFRNHHPTVKPIKLMEYLIKLVTPPNGIVLDPFMGSGSTGVAAKKLGFEFVGIEMNKEYFEIAQKRIDDHASR